jgi:hypothetical protein
MKLRVLIATLALASAGAAAAALPLLTGTFTRKITGKAPPFNGTWALQLKTKGKFEMRRNGVVVVRGLGAATRGKLALTDQSGAYACRGAERVGAYTYTFKGKTLRLKAVLDPCSGRKTILTSGPFKKQ